MWPHARPCFVCLSSMNIDRLLLLVYNTDQQDTWSRITGFIFQLISSLKETYRSLHHHLTTRRGNEKGDEREWRHTTRTSALQKPLRDFLYLFLCRFLYQNRKQYQRKIRNKISQILQHRAIDVLKPLLGLWTVYTRNQFLCSFTYCRIKGRYFVANT